MQTVAVARYDWLDHVRALARAGELADLRSGIKLAGQGYIGGGLEDGRADFRIIAFAPGPRFLPGTETVTVEFRGGTRTAGLLRGRREAA